MKKRFTMLLASLFLTLGTAWAQVPYTVSANTGTGVDTSGWSNTWTATSNPATLKLLCTAGNMQAESDGLLSMYVGQSSPSTYTLQVANTHKIVSYSFKFKRDGNYAENENVTLKVNGSDYAPTDEEQLVEVRNVNATSTTFQMAGSNKGIIASEFVVNVERVFESGYYTIQCNGNNKFANYNGGERIVPMDMGRFPTSVYLFTKGDNGMYTIQTSDKKFVTYKGTGTGDQVAIVDAASANDNNKWWVINETSAEVFTIVPKQDNIANATPGWNYSVNFGGANGALGLWGRDDGNSKWLIKVAPIMTSGTAKIKCAGTYVTLGSGATLFTKGNADNACQFTILADEEGKYTIQLADGRYVTHKSSNTGDQIEIVEAGNATDDNKWWVIAPNVTNQKSTGNEVDIIPARGNVIGRGTAAWNWSVNTNANLGFWGASDNGSRCTIEWTPTTFTYSYSYNGQVKRTEQAQGFVGYPYPAPTLSVFGVVPAPIVGDIVAGDQGKTFDMEYTIDLPFQFADSYDNIEHWYFMKIRDDGFTYMGYDAEKSYIRADQSNVPVASKDAYIWGFVGNPFDGFSIVNYATGKTKVLSAPKAPTGNGNADELARMVEVTNEYTGNLVWNFKAPTHPNPKPGVFYIEHPAATSYAFNRQDYDGAKALCYWNQRDTGSAVQVVERGLFNLDDLKNQGIYALQAERSPLLYDANAERPIKLSSGMVSSIVANENDVNQQFMIGKSDTDGLYYLYSVGAEKFVDADLNFTDYPEPVLSFEANPANPVFPWFVKIGGKYVVPGNGGTDGNKLHHTSTPSDDDGKRYRIVNVGENSELAQSLESSIEEVKSLELSLDELVSMAVAVKENNSQQSGLETLDAALATVESFRNNAPKEVSSLRTIVEELQETLDGLLSENTTYVTSLGENSNHPVLIAAPRSVWAVADNGRAMTTIAELGIEANPSDLKQQFAIITPDEGENYYIYSVNAKRFVKKNNTLGAQGDPIQLNDASSIGENRRQFQFKGEELYVNVGGANQIVINGWKDLDVGNACEIVQYDLLTFDLEEALDIFNSGADITLTYKVGDHQLTTTTYKKKGETYSFSNPYAFTTVTSCKKDGEDLEATEGTYSFEITGDAHIVVELQENLPFRYAASYDKIEYWYFMKIRDDNFTYMGYDAEKAYIRANQSTVPAESKDAYTWGFVGNLLEGFSIVNYATGKTKVLSAPKAPTGNGNADELARMVEVTNEYTGNLVWNFKAPTHDGSKPGVFYIEHPTATSYAFNRQGYEGANAVCYWTGRDTGSAIQVEERGVFNLSDLKTDRVYALQAERSPLMYSATEGMTTKLSSGMVDGISADASETNQQFLIIRSKTEGEYYLYSVGAKMFVDANLNFTYYPEPVLSFEANEKVESKNLIYPWYVKIAGKYVVPGGGGTAGNKLFHTSTPDEDDGKRYRIVNAGAYDASAVLAVIKKVENLVESTADLSNSKVYTVTPKANATTGVWDVKYDGENATMLAITKFTGNAVDPANSNQQFAFLTVNGEHYLYSYGAKKFVAKNEGGQMLTDELSSACRVEFLTSTIASEQKLFPLVVKVGGSQLHSSYQNHLDEKGGIITTWDHTESGGNAVAIVAVDGTVDLSEAIAKVEAYQLLKFTSELKNLIDEAQALLKKNYLDSEDKQMLTDAMATAQLVHDKEGVTFDELNEQIGLLSEAIDAVTYVREVEDFKNAYVYTFVTLRGWVGADANSANLIGTVNPKVDPAPTPSDDNTMFQWAVYKSENEHYYLYNIGKGKFMGLPNGETIPFAATPQGMDLTFKRHNNANEKWADYPIMFSPDNRGAVSQNGNAGLFYWSGGWNTTNDDGSNHQVTIVGALAEETLTTIAEAVNRYEAIQALETAIAAAQAKVDEMSDAIGYYSSSIDNVDTKLEAIVAFKEEDITESTVPEIEAQTAAAEVIIASFSLNLPETGKYYRFKHPTEDAYMLSDDYSENNNRLAMGDNKVSSIFYYGKDGALLSYANGCYLPKAVLKGDWTCLPAGTIAPPAATFGGGTTIGRVGFYVGDAADRAYYSGRVTYVDAGGNFGSDEGYDWIVEEVTTLPLTVSAVGYASFYTPVEVTLPDGIAAYAIEEGKITQDNEDGTVKLSDPITVIPANTGVILYANGGGDFELDITNTKAQALEGNLLSGASAKTLVEGDAYVLANKARGIGLYPVALTRDKSGATGGTTHFLNGANKAYLPKNVITTSNVRSLIFRFGDTGVEDMQAVPQHTLIYDLMGRPVERMEKGIYIVNGRKVVK